MRRPLARMANAVFWVAVWIGIHFYSSTFGDPARLLGEAMIPVIWFVIDLALRESHSKREK